MVEGLVVASLLEEENTRMAFPRKAILVLLENSLCHEIEYACQMGRKQYFIL